MFETLTPSSVQRCSRAIPVAAKAEGERCSFRRHLRWLSPPPPAFRDQARPGPRQRPRKTLKLESRFSTQLDSISRSPQALRPCVGVSTGCCIRGGGSKQRASDAWFWSRSWFRVQGRNKATSRRRQAERRRAQQQGERASSLHEPRASALHVCEGRVQRRDPRNRLPLWHGRLCLGSQDGIMAT